MAAACPRVREDFGSVRWKMTVKKASMLEKLCVGVFGLILNCLFVRLARSMAMISPRIVTTRALNFNASGMVMTGVFLGM